MKNQVSFVKTLTTELGHEVTFTGKLTKNENGNIRLSADKDTSLSTNAILEVDGELSEKDIILLAQKLQVPTLTAKDVSLFYVKVTALIDNGVTYLNNCD